MPTMLSPLRRATQVAGARPAVTCGDVTLTYAETWDRCRRLAGALRGLGLSEGDRVAVVGPNCHRYLELYVGLPAAGLVIVPLNPRHSDAELRYALDDSGAKVLFAGRPVGDLPPCVDTVDRHGRGRTKSCSRAPRRPTSPTTSARRTSPGSSTPGGTTGASKGVMLTHRNLVANATHIQIAWPFRRTRAGSSSRRCSTRPGSIAVLSTIWNAGRHVVLPAFDPGAALDLIERERRDRHARRADACSRRWTRSSSRGRATSPRSSCLSHGGAPIATETLRRAHAGVPRRRAGARLRRDRDRADRDLAARRRGRCSTRPRARSCGQPAVGVEVEIRAPRAATAAGRRGRRGRRPRRRTSWAATGTSPSRPPPRSSTAGTAPATSATWTTQAYVYLVDRAKDMIVTGGENVYCTEVEDVLYRHPAVLEAAVFGIPDERWGEAVHAVVVPRAAGDRRGARRALPRGDRRLQGAEDDRRPGRAAAEVGRGQGPQARAARAALGRAGVDGVGGLRRTGPAHRAGGGR